jgi:hypothetical protein
MINKLEPDDCPERESFCDTLQAKMDNVETIAQRLVLGDETIFHTSGKVNRHNLYV